MLVNAFDYIGDFAKAQQLANEWDMEKRFKKLQWLAGIHCPAHKKIDEKHHWSIMQQEYATDIVFKKQADLKPIYEDLIATAIHTVKPANIATFLGQKLNGNYQGKVGYNYNIRIEGRRIKHSMGPVSIKMYDKFNKIISVDTRNMFAQFVAFQFYHMLITYAAPKTTMFDGFIQLFVTCFLPLFFCRCL